MNETTSECRGCGRPTRDAAYVCDPCGDELAKALGDLPWLDEELEVTITRQQGIDYRNHGGHGKGGKKPAEMPSPANMGASEARTHLKALLVSWTLFCEAEQIRNTDYRNGLPSDDIPSLSRWLLWRVDGLALHEIGPDAVEEITSAVAHCHRLIDRKPEQQYLGECVCGGDLYAAPGGTWATCHACATTVPADEIRTKMLAELDDRLCTAAEIARLATYLGLRANREQVRKRINAWHSRKTLMAESSFCDEPTFRFGKVYERLLASEYATTEKAG